MVERSSWATVQWYETFHIRTVEKWSKNGITVAEGTEGAKKFVDVDPKEYDRRELYRMRDIRGREAGVVSRGELAYETSEVALAEGHYSDSLLKLAVRIKEKALDVSKLTVNTELSSVRQNGIDTLITDGVNKVHAWTILAWGEVVRPHYRYLVK